MRKSCHAIDFNSRNHPFQNKLISRLRFVLFDQIWSLCQIIEMKILINAPDNVAVAKSNRLRWAGRVLRMDDSEVVKKIYKPKAYVLGEDQ